MYIGKFLTFSAMANLDDTPTSNFATHSSLLVCCIKSWQCSSPFIYRCVDTKAPDSRETNLNKES